MSRTVRDLTAEPIPADVLERIIAAGIQAPTYDHRREWEFVILLGEEEKENALQFVKAFAEAQGENRFVSASASPQQKMYADAMPKQYSMLRKSGCVILPCYIGLGYPAKDAAVLEQVERPVKNTHSALRITSPYCHVCMRLQTVSILTSTTRLPLMEKRLSRAFRA